MTSLPMTLRVWFAPARNWEKSTPREVVLAAEFRLMIVPVS